MSKNIKEGIFMEHNDDLADRLEKRFGDKTLGEIEKEKGITNYNNTGVGFGYIVKGELPKNKNEAMKIFDPSKIGKL